MLYSVYAEASKVIEGKSLPPSNVSNLSVTLSPITGVVSVRWDNPPELDVTSYEVRHRLGHGAYDTATILGSTSSSLYEYVPSDMAVGTNYYLVRAVDSSGNYSVSAEAAPLVVEQPVAMSPITFSVSENGYIDLSWLTPAGIQAPVSEYTLYEGLGASRVELSKVPSTSKTFSKLVDWSISSNPTYSISYTNSLGIESVFSTETLINITLSTAPVISSKSYFEGGSYNLVWEATTRSETNLPVVSYLVRYGDPSDPIESSIELTNTSSLGAPMPANWGTNISRIVYIESIDTAGNISMPASTTISIGPPVLENATASLSTGSNVLTVSWESLPSSLPIDEYEVRASDSFGSTVIAPLFKGKANSYATVINSVDTINFYIKAKDTQGNWSEGYISVSFTPEVPGNVSSITGEYISTTYTVGWLPPVTSSSSMPISHYIVNKGTQELNNSVGTTSYTTSVDWDVSNPPSFEIKTVDTLGQVSTGYTQQSVFSNPPLISDHTSKALGSSGTFEISWASVVGSVSTNYYEIREDNPADAEWGVGYLKQGGATRYVRDIDWGETYELDVASGTSSWIGSSEKSFYIRAVDILGNLGDVSVINVNVARVDTTPVISSQVLDNNILLDWDAIPSPSIPIDYYEIFKCSDANCTFEEAVIGTNNYNGIHQSSTFHSAFERAKGTYRYWIQPVDVTGRKGLPSYNVSTMSQPPAYEIIDTLSATLSGTPLGNSRVYRDNVYESDTGDIFVPVDTAESWAGYYTARNFGSVSDAPVGSNFLSATTYYNPAIILQQWDMLAEVGSVQTTLKYLHDIQAQPGVESGTNLATVIRTLPDSAASQAIYDRVDLLDSAGWGPTQTLDNYGTLNNFRFIRIQHTLDVLDPDRRAILKVSSREVSLEVREISETGQAAVLVGSAESGKVIEFSKSFAKLSHISITPKIGGASEPILAVYDFDDATSPPTQFTVYLFNMSGTKVAGNFSWSITGLEGSI